MQIPLWYSKRTAENPECPCIMGASKDNLDLLVGGTEVLKQDVVGQIESNRRFYLKNLLPLSIIVSLADHLEVILIYKRLQF